jgi:hypothetical protein
MLEQIEAMASHAVRYGMKMTTPMKRNTGIVGREYGGAKASIGLSKRFAFAPRLHPRVEKSSRRDNHG